MIVGMGHDDGVTAPVVGSGICPAWIALVAKLGRSVSHWLCILGVAALLVAVRLLTADRAYAVGAVLAVTDAVILAPYMSGLPSRPVGRKISTTIATSDTK